jgi:hypothetical protein
MNEEEQVREPRVVSRVWYRHQLVFFISGSIIVALMLVLVSMALYASSGAAQLDLSRPGYKSVQNQLDQSDTFESFPSSGAVTGKTLDDFLKLYQKQVKPVDNSDVFSPNTLDDQALGIDDPNVSNQ